MRVGTDGEFCSREHRNQYRLRRSLDQLQEANVMASLLRRREQFKLLVPSPVPASGGERRSEFMPQPHAASSQPIAKPVMPLLPSTVATAEANSLCAMPERRESRPLPLIAVSAQPRAFSAIQRRPPGAPLLRPFRAPSPSVCHQPPGTSRPLVAPAAGAFVRASAVLRFPIRRTVLRSAAKTGPFPVRFETQLRPLAGACPAASSQRRDAVVRFTSQDSPIGYPDRESDTP